MTRYYILGVVLIALIASYGLSGGFAGATSVVTDSKTQTTYQTMESILGSAVHIRNQTSTAPTSTYYQAASADFPVVPVDSLTPSTATAFTVSSYTDSYNNPGLVVLDSVVHPNASLTGLPKYATAGTPPAATCALDCTKLVVDEHFGRMGM